MFDDPPADLEPAAYVWDAREPIVRVHSALYGNVFHRGPEATSGLIAARTRFAHFRPGERQRWVGTLYGGQDDLAALSETVFHTVPTSTGDLRPRRVLARPWFAHLMTELHVSRDLRLVDLTPGGLRRLGVGEDVIIDAPASAYPTTVAWARALYLASPWADGMVWRSRQRKNRLAVVLWERRRRDVTGGRLRQSDFEVQAAPVPLLSTRGLVRVMNAAEDLDITLVPPNGI